MKKSKHKKLGRKLVKQLSKLCGEAIHRLENNARIVNPEYMEEDVWKLVKLSNMNNE